jgi:hypothetical protein
MHIFSDIFSTHNFCLYYVYYLQKYKNLSNYIIKWMSKIILFIQRIYSHKRLPPHLLIIDSQSYFVRGFLFPF